MRPGATRPRTKDQGPSTNRGFTLIELLVVILIILIISAVALPVVLPAFSHRQVSEAARILQGAFVGAHDNAIHNNRPSGIRLLPDPVFNGGFNASTGQLDPTQILACNRIIPIDPAPEYSEGYVNINLTPPTPSLLVPYPVPGNNNNIVYPIFGAVPALLPGAGAPNVLMVEESFFVPGSLQPNPPTSWFWNIRVGDKIQINNAGPWYTVIGPMTVGPAGGNSELFVNVGLPGTTSPLVRPNIINNNNAGNYFPDFLFLVNGQDDNKNGWVDEGWDGVNNNNDTSRLVNELAEWQANLGFNSVSGVSNVPPEAEQWLGSIGTHGVTNVPYTIQRRPAPTTNAREIALPTNVVIDLTSWGSSLERSRVPAGAFNQFTGYVDIVVNPDGTIVPNTIYSSPSTSGLGSAFIHLWLAERSDLAAPDTTQSSAPYLPLPQGLAPTRFAGGTEIKGEYRLLTIFNRTGQSATIDAMPFDITNLGTANYNTSLPFLGAQQGISGGP